MPKVLTQTMHSGRTTRQRSAIRDILETATHPLSVSELHEMASRDVSKLGIATVYRSIASLIEEGSLSVVDIAGEPPRYEMGGKKHHHHFHCTRCRRVYDIAGCVGDPSRLAPPRFRVASHDVTLAGTCASCNSKKRTP
jgi:Fur family ferric uptake transcriptional regulator